MEYVKNLLTDQAKLHYREAGRASNQGHVNKAARLRDELGQLNWALFRLGLCDE